MPVCILVKTIIPRYRGQPDALLHEAEGNEYPHFMFLTVNNEVMGVARCQTMPQIRHYYAQVVERLRVRSSEAGNEAMV